MTISGKAIFSRIHNQCLYLDSNKSVESGYRTFTEILFTIPEVARIRTLFPFIPLILKNSSFSRDEKDSLYESNG